MRRKFKVVIEIEAVGCDDPECPWGYQPTAKEIVENIVEQWAEMSSTGLLDPEHEATIMSSEIKEI